MGDWTTDTLTRWGQWKGCISRCPKWPPCGVCTELQSRKGVVTEVGKESKLNDWILWRAEDIQHAMPGLWIFLHQTEQHGLFVCVCSSNLFVGWSNAADREIRGRTSRGGRSSERCQNVEPFYLFKSSGFAEVALEKENWVGDQASQIIWVQIIKFITRKLWKLQQ